MILNLDPRYLVFLSRWNESAKQIVECYDWPEKYSDILLNSELTALFQTYGTICSVSPSGQFCLLAKPSNDAQKWIVHVIDMDSITTLNQFSLPSTAFNSPFSCFQWICNESEVSLLLFGFPNS